MSATLLDANVLIALVVAEHEHHEIAAHWAANTPRIALCPTVQGALMRFLLRVGESRQSARAVLAAFTADERCDFWPDDIPYGAVDLGHVTGHRQVTDAYLAAIARHHKAKIATLDHGFASVLPDVVELIV